MFFSASCTKEVVQTKSEPTPTPVPEAKKAPDIPPVENEQDAQLMKQLKTEAAAREVQEAAIVSEKVHFAFDSSALSDHARQLLNSMADYLQKNQDINITVEGHCDDRGSDAYNIALGERRAESVRDFLVNQGIETSRLKTVSYGKERPIATGENETAWAQNRRAQFVVN
jgi:peptidoglycan-associated lipoprotein